MCHWLVGFQCSLLGIDAVQVEISDTMKRQKKAGLKVGGSPPGMMTSSHTGSNPTPTMLVKKRDGEPPKITSYIPGMSDTGRQESGHTKSSAAKKRKGRSLWLPMPCLLLECAGFCTWSGHDLVRVIITVGSGWGVPRVCTVVPVSHEGAENSA